ncbi:hypothetical protein ABG067_007875, partial [Albugo candida]
MISFMTTKPTRNCIRHRIRKTCVRSMKVSSPAVKTKKNNCGKSQPSKHMRTKTWMRYRHHRRDCMGHLRLRA